jgi:hypothetical protein
MLGIILLASNGGYLAGWYAAQMFLTPGTRPVLKTEHLNFY